MLHGWITGLGMVTSLGLDVAMSCAGARAGIVRSRVAQGFRIRSAVDGLEDSVVVHPVDLLTRGFEGNARTVRLLQGAIDDLARGDGAAMTVPRLSCFFALADPNRVLSGLPLVADPTARASRESAAQAVEPVTPEDAAWSLHARLRWRGAVPLVLDYGGVAGTGHTAFADAVALALAHLERTNEPAALVLAADSLLEEGTLDWLHVRGRLKCAAAPAGIQPGEAAGATLVSRSPHGPEGTGRRARARIVVSGSHKEERTLLEGAAPTGVGLASAIAEAREAAGRAIAWVVSDHNGEPYRALDWGHAIARLRADDDGFESPVVTLPAASFGDTGAASGFAGLATAIHAFDRRCAPSDAAIVVSASDGAERRACVVLPSETAA